MMKKIVTLILTLCIISIFSKANPIDTHPQPKQSFKPNQIQEQATTCYYAATIKTSCSSPSYTADHISVAFGDTYGSQVYVTKLDGLVAGSFNKCALCVFEIIGPCTIDVCYLYFYRTGFHGWVPDSVTISGHSTAPISFYFNSDVPHGLWYGIDICKNETVDPILPRV